MRKSVLTGSETNVQFSVPIQKVDRERRLVHGFASLDNDDKQGDRVLAKASVEAFSSFRGNIREMHDKIAAGRMVKFEEAGYMDPETGKFYNGIHVTAYVSKGAQSTWEKVLDGTLSGFSIGGEVDKYHMEKSDDGGAVRVITKYHLNELSLVDNPANQFANIVSFEKVDGGTVVKGIATEVETQTIFFCPVDTTAVVSKDEKYDCTQCGNQMENIGWCESTGDVMEDMQKAITSRMTDNEGGANEMTVKNTNDNVEKSDTGPEAQAQDANVTTEEAIAAEAATPDTEEVEAAEVTDEEPVEAGDADEDTEEDLTAVLEKFQEKVIKTIEEGQSKHGEQVDELRKELTGIEGKIESRLEELEKSLSKLEADQSELGKSFKSIETKVLDVEKGLDAVDSTTAIKKSVDTDQSAGSEPEATQSRWGGAFLNTVSL